MRLVVLLLVATAAACVETGKGPQPVDARYIRAHLLTELPANIDRFDLALGDGAVIYAGNVIDRTRVVPGQSLTIKHYWRVVRPIGKGWRLFGLVRGPAGSADFMNLDPTDMQRGYPVETWKAGDIIEDEQTITVRPDWTTSRATVLVGLIAVNKHTTLDRMAVSGPRTHDRAIIAATLDIDLSRAPPPPGTIHVTRASGPITIDGMPLDQAWTTALTSPEFITGEQSAAPPGKATAKVTWDDTYLYMFISVVDSDVTSPYTNHDDPLWKADCVEIFLDADGNQRGYIELQVNPRNVTFDSWFATTRAQPGDVSWTSNMVTQVKVRGTPDPDDADQGWDVEIGIPWAAVKGNDPNMAVRTPPRVGDRWRFNINRVDIRSTNPSQTVSSWKRIGNDWHALDRMLTVVFADATGSTKPKADTPEEPAPGGGSAEGAGSSAGPAAGSAAGSSAAAEPPAPATRPPAGSTPTTRTPAGSAAPR